VQGDNCEDKKDNRQTGIVKQFVGYELSDFDSIRNDSLCAAR
jgi:hypothetical protein